MEIISFPGFIFNSSIDTILEEKKKDTIGKVTFVQGRIDSECRIISSRGMEAERVEC